MKISLYWKALQLLLEYELLILVVHNFFFYIILYYIQYNIYPNYEKIKILQPLNTWNESDYTEENIENSAVSISLVKMTLTS